MAAQTPAARLTAGSHHVHLPLQLPFSTGCHYIDLQVANVRRVTAAGLTFDDTVYVVYLRLFANQPSPSILVVAGRPPGVLAPFVSTMDLAVEG